MNLTKFANKIKEEFKKNSFKIKNKRWIKHGELTLDVNEYLQVRLNER